MQINITAVSFLDWWNGLSIKAQETYIRYHNREDKNYAIAATNRKKIRSAKDPIGEAWAKKTGETLKTHASRREAEVRSAQ